MIIAKLVLLLIYYWVLCQRNPEVGKEVHRMSELWPKKEEVIEAAPEAGSEDVGLLTKIIVFMNPIASVLFYLLWRDTKPVAAKATIRVGWIATVVWTCISLAILIIYPIIIFFVLFASMASVFSYL